MGLKIATKESSSCIVITCGKKLHILQDIKICAIVMLESDRKWCEHILEKIDCKNHKDLTKNKFMICISYNKHNFFLCGPYDFNTLSFQGCVHTIFRHFKA